MWNRICIVFYLRCLERGRLLLRLVLACSGCIFNFLFNNLLQFFSIETCTLCLAGEEGRKKTRFYWPWWSPTMWWWWWWWWIQWRTFRPCLCFMWRWWWYFGVCIYVRTQNSLIDAWFRHLVTMHGFVQLNIDWLCVHLLEEWEFPTLGYYGMLKNIIASCLFIISLFLPPIWPFPFLCI